MLDKNLDASKMILLLICLFGVTAQAQENSALYNTQNSYTEYPHRDPESGKWMVSKGRYVTGGILSSTAGLGIGHAAQGRYWDKGWLFTATEVIGLAMLIPECYPSRRHITATTRHEGDCEDSQRAYWGARLFLGFHIWEIIDSWTQARPYSKPSQVSATIVPTADGAAFDLAFGF